jgi:hypothetical protein
MFFKPHSLSYFTSIYHAKAKIVKKMNQYYPDFRAIKQNLTTIFAIIQQYGSYPTPDNLLKNLKTDISNFPSFMQQ